MSHYAVVMVPVRVELIARDPIVASEEARKYARAVEPVQVGRDTIFEAKVMAVQLDRLDNQPPIAA